MAEWTAYAGRGWCAQMEWAVQMEMLVEIANEIEYK